jgi:integrase
MQEQFKDVEITEDEARQWALSLITPKRTAVTVADIWIGAARRVFAWAKGQKLVADNPFKEIKITVPRKSLTREGKSFTEAEAQTILRAALAIDDQETFAGAQRWIPWICAYSGARAGEITQLRGQDIEQRGDLWVMRLTPEAGTIKTRKPRAVPLHDHIIAQGFLDFVTRRGQGPLFYNADNGENGNDPLNPRRPRAVKTRERLAHWVRDLGIDDPEVRPNHAWRHTFKQIAERHGISERVSDAITGHAAATVGRTYGAPTVEDMARELGKFPRYEV